MNQQQFIKRLQQLIAEKGTQKEAARYLGISAAYLSDILAGKRTAGPKILNKLGLEPRTVYVSKEVVA
jgi:transcriptional regulator with XRE-family HTH domain